MIDAALEADRDTEETLDDLADRARLRGAIPTLELSARRGQTVDLSQNQNLTSDTLRLSTDDDLTLQARLHFDLPRLLFAREELAVERQRRAHRTAQRALVDTVTTLYFERRRLLLRIAQHPGDSAQRAEASLRIEEIEARLDAFTGGRFHRMMDRLHAESTRSPAL